MRLEKHQEGIKEVMEEIEAALHDTKGVLSHQRRLALMLPLGMCELIEVYFHHLEIIKSGARIKHDWFRQKRIREKLEEQVISSLDNVPNIDVIIRLAVALEESRDYLVYSSPKVDEQFLRQKIGQFLELKRLIEQKIGEHHGSA
ncbi:hypothetical protein HYU19_03175 [Candidatus Woesearchaeota archaeon]|nr:hypothetical protein [Candidatus Woesearchaeota archaeon]